ncbi:transcriptional regulator [Helicobacter pylori]|uniref:transcriptional regulator n=1 Tax=Helicobacter pylori TaxID=210 RepID=UPI000EB4B463|nr:transcriptional regulator [Helicobacter pylori]
MGRLIEKWFGFSQIREEREELEARIGELENENAELLREREYLAAETSELKDANNQLRQALENSNAQLAQAKENIAEEKTELEREIACLKSLEATDKSDLDLQNWRFKSAIEDLKRQNRKLEEENMALKERVDGLNEQLFTLQPQKPQ